MNDEINQIELELLKEHINFDFIKDFKQETELLRKFKQYYTKNIEISTEKTEKVFSKLIENRLYWSFDFNDISYQEADEKLIHFVQICQTIRLLSKNPSNLEKFSTLNDSIIKIEIILMNITDIINSNYSVLSRYKSYETLKQTLINILIEIITIIKRFVTDKSSTQLELFFGKIFDSRIFYYFISLISFDDEIVSKLFNLIFVKLFTDTKFNNLLSEYFTSYIALSNLLVGMENLKLNGYIFEYVTFLCEKQSFRKMFLNQDGLKIIIKYSFYLVSLLNIKKTIVMVLIVRF